MLPIVGQMAGPNKLKFFYGHSGVVGGCLRLKKFELFYIFSKFFFQIYFFPRATPGPSASPSIY